MGNCCNASFIDNDILNNSDNKKEKGKVFSSIDFNNHSKNNTGINNNINKLNTDSNINLDKEQNPKSDQDKIIFISKTKLKLIVKQSKCLLEGKEYLINSLGLFDSNSKNNFQDGLVIFGDNDVSKKNIS